MTPPCLWFHAQHSAAGAALSLTFGARNRRGGLGVALPGPAEQELFIGVQDKEAIKLLPFPSQLGATLEHFLVEGEIHESQGFEAYQDADVERSIDPFVDRFTTPDFRLEVFTPEPELDAPPSSVAFRRALRPSVALRLAAHNSSQHVRRYFFALDFKRAGLAPTHLPLGYQLGRRLGWRARAVNGATRGFLRFSLQEGLLGMVSEHGLGTCSGVVLELNPGERGELCVVCASFDTNPAVASEPYAYTHLFANLEQVLAEALDDFEASCELAQQQAEKLVPLDAARALIRTQAIRSYWGNTQLTTLTPDTPLEFTTVEPTAGSLLAPVIVCPKLRWIVLEGEYQMINTLDLSVDQMFYELSRAPWLVRNVLEQFANDYEYRDQCGISFAHDMGVAGCLSAPGTSAYELPGLHGCWSYMSFEELCNWLLMATSYIVKTGDTAFLAAQRERIEAALSSLLARTSGAGPDGVMNIDSSRCQGGREITTYDSLDASLGPARLSSYLAVKTWATLLGVERLLGDGRAFSAARRTAETIVAFRLDDGSLPAVLDPAAGAARVLPTVEGVIYPIYWATVAPTARNDLAPDGPFAELFAVLRSHVEALLFDPQRRNHFADGGLRLSSSSENSWISKLIVFDVVARHLLAEATPALDSAMTAHARWLTEGSADWAYSDQIVRGIARGSRYYPRGVTCELWSLSANRTS